MMETGRAAHSNINLTTDVFIHRVAASNVDIDKLASLHAADLYLCCACAAQQPQALAAFDKSFLSQIDRFLARMNQNAAFVDEVRQMVREKLFVAAPGKRPKIAEYSGHGALTNWLRVIATRTAVDLLRQRGELLHDRGQSPNELADGPGPDAELGYIKERYRQQFKEALQASVAALSGEQQNLLRMHFLDGVTLEDLAVFFRVHRSTIVRRIAAARELMIDEVRRTICDRLTIESTEFESLLGLLRSRLDLSLPTLLTGVAQ
jgi:RNA polymerase sigma-70 factor (ECF subfamily)